MTTKIDRTGHRYGRLVVVGKNTDKKRAYWDCACDCGNSTTVRGDHLKEGRVSSCGCFHDDIKTTHGMSRSPEYFCWTNMKARCADPSNKHFKNYGGRGIIICPTWLESFENFFADMGPIPEPGLTLERIDNERGYFKDNCTWATRAEQVRNRRNSILHTIGGETLCLKDWCARLNVSYHMALYYKRKGVAINDILGIS